uniref:SSB16=(GAL4(1-147))-SSB16 transcriptional repressor component n=1 Tax=Escherichia coli TaxID=562 RepID=Q9R5Z2_ECOLX|nr:SSB16=(GAL4(1-147))-SSB16 transcriptional repressor component [Escherichia coli, Peptide, 92 aa] [Escherichia coli]
PGIALDKKHQCGTEGFSKPCGGRRAPERSDPGDTVFRDDRSGLVRRKAYHYASSLFKGNNLDASACRFCNVIITQKDCNVTHRGSAEDADSK